MKPHWLDARDENAAVRTDLGVVRTALSAERTLMSWIRTSLSMITFGFTIFKFVQALSEHRAEGPRYLGIILAALGTASLAAGTLQYHHVLGKMGMRSPGLTLYVAIAVMAVGVLVLFGLVLRLGPLA
jgi:putative membrane protein